MDLYFCHYRVKAHIKAVTQRFCLPAPTTPTNDAALGTVTVKPASNWLHRGEPYAGVPDQANIAADTP